MVNMPFSISGYGVSLMDVSVSAVTNTVAYDAFGRQIVHIDGRGNTTHTEYNAFGQRSASIDALGNRTSYAYDQFGNLAAVTNALGNATIDTLGTPNFSQRVALRREAFRRSVSEALLLAVGV